jgi:hypothetical protein
MFKILKMTKKKFSFQKNRKINRKQKRQNRKKNRKPRKNKKKEQKLTTKSEKTSHMMLTRRGPNMPPTRAGCFTSRNGQDVGNPKVQLIR